MQKIPLNELMRQYPLDFSPPVIIEPRRGPVIPPRLLILACSATKAEGDAMPARERYIGPLWQTLKAADPEGRLAYVSYLSARFGFGDARADLPNYNQLLTSKAADTMIERGLHGFYPNYPTDFRTEGARLRHLATRDKLQTGAKAICDLSRDLGVQFEDVAICGGKHYVRVAEALIAEMRDEGFIALDAPVTIINDQIGYMRTKLRRWIEEG